MPGQAAASMKGHYWTDRKELLAEKQVEIKAHKMLEDSVQPPLKVQKQLMHRRFRLTRILISFVGLLFLLFFAGDACEFGKVFIRRDTQAENGQN